MQIRVCKLFCLIFRKVNHFVDFRGWRHFALWIGSGDTNNVMRILHRPTIHKFSIRKGKMATTKDCSFTYEFVYHQRLFCIIWVELWQKRTTDGRTAQNTQRVLQMNSNNRNSHIQSLSEIALQKSIFLLFLPVLCRPYLFYRTRPYCIFCKGSCQRLLLNLAVLLICCMLCCRPAYVLQIIYYVRVCILDLCLWASKNKWYNTIFFY